MVGSASASAIGREWLETFVKEPPGSGGVGPNMTANASGESTRDESATSAAWTSTQPSPSDNMAQARGITITAGRPSQEQNVKDGEGVDTTNNVESAEEYDKTSNQSLN